MIREFDRTSLPILYTVLQDLHHLAVRSTKDTSTTTPSDTSQDPASSSQQRSNLSECARTMMRAFTFCLNDRNPLQVSRKWGTLKCFAMLFRCYRQLDTLNLVKNLFRAIDAADLPLIYSPNDANNNGGETETGVQKRLGKKGDGNKKQTSHYQSRFPRSEVTMYMYYRGYYHLMTQDTAQGHQDALRHFRLAYDLCHSALEQCIAKKDQRIVLRNQARILKYLIPLELLVDGRLPSQELLDYVSLVDAPLCELYTGLVKAIRMGDIGWFERTVGQDDQVMHLLLRHDLFLIVEKCRLMIMQRLVKRVFAILESSTRLPLQAVKTAFALSDAQGDEDAAQVECWLCVLISKGLIKGYLAHEQAMLVLSKQQPFPHIAQASL